jgi:hypothetical protein
VSRRGQRAWSAFLLLFSPSLCGCSFVFARGPSAQAVQSNRSPAAECRSQQTVPLDAVLSAASVVRALYVAGSDDSIYPNRHDTRIRNLDIAATALLAATFLASARYGDELTSECDQAELRARGARARKERAPP